MPAEARPDLLRGPDARLDRRARGRPRRRAAADRRRVPEPASTASPSVKHGLLQADPTVIYAVDTDKLGKYSPDWAEYVFWTVPEGGALRDQQLPEALAGYNTYMVAGLPPGPDRDAEPRLDRRGAQARTRRAASRTSSRSPTATAPTTSARRSPSTSEAREVRLSGLGGRPARCRSPRTSRRRPTPRPAPRWREAERRAPARRGSRASASGWRRPASTPTSAPAASTCAG